jgi:hypothetical protein
MLSNTDKTNEDVASAIEIKSDFAPDHDVLRKKFRIPCAWRVKTEILELAEHRHAVTDAKDIFLFIEERLKRLGYMEDYNSMVHDYLHFMIAYLMQEKGEVFPTKINLRESSPQQKKLLNGTNHDFIFQRVNGREKTLILDVYIGNKDLTLSKARLFRRISRHHSIQSCIEVRDLLLPTRLDYLTKNFQISLTEYLYWKACMKLQKVVLMMSKTYV